MPFTHTLRWLKRLFCFTNEKPLMSISLPDFNSPLPMTDSSINLPLSSSRLKTFLFHKSFPPWSKMGSAKPSGLTQPCLLSIPFLCLYAEDSILHSVLMAVEWLFRHNYPNLNDFVWNLEYNCGATVRTRMRTKKLRKSPQGSAKRILFFMLPRQRSYLSCIDFDHFWNTRSEIVYRSVHP